MVKKTIKRVSSYKQVSVATKDYDEFDAVRQLLQDASPVPVKMPQMLIVAVATLREKLTK